MGIIYKIRNIVNNKIYIGSTTRKIETRFYEHIYSLNNNLHSNNKLQNAWNKYGESNFEFSVIKKVSDKLLLKKEKKEIINAVEILGRDNVYNIINNDYDISKLYKIKKCKIPIDYICTVCGGVSENIADYSKFECLCNSCKDVRYENLCNIKSKILFRKTVSELYALHEKTEEQSIFLKRYETDRNYEESDYEYID